MSGGRKVQSNIRVSLEDLIVECRQMKMRRTRADIYPYRIQKFENRGWNISKDIYSPVIYKTLQTMVEKSSEEYLDIPAFLRRQAD